MGMLQQLLMMLVLAEEWSDLGLSHILRTRGACCSMLFLGVLYVIAAVKTKVFRWRLFFVAKMVAMAVAYSLPGVMTGFFTTMRWHAVFSCGPQILLCAFLVGVAARDFRERAPTRSQYRWTHWLGIAVQLWSGAVLIVYAIWWTLFGAFA